MILPWGIVVESIEGENQQGLQNPIKFDITIKGVSAEAPTASHIVNKPTKTDIVAKAPMSKPTIEK